MAIITSTNKAAFPDVQHFPAQDIIPEALIMQVTEFGPLVDSDERQVRAPYVADDVEAGFVAEGDDILPQDPTLDELVINTDKIATLTKVSREAYETDGISGLLTNSLRRSVVVKADNAFLKNTSNPNGIATTQGIVDGGTIGSDLDKLVDLIATLEGNGAMPSHIIASPQAWATMQKIKAGTSLKTPLIGATQDATMKLLLGIPVIVNRSAPANTLHVLDKSQIISSFSPVDVATSTDHYFDSDSVAVRLTMRLGWGVVRADRIGKLSLS